MPELRNIRHEKFVQGLLTGLNQTQAYIRAGYSERGAKQSAARLLNNPNVRSRLAELRAENSTQFSQLAVTERDQRLLALQDRWDRVRKAIEARSVGDYAAMMRTGIVCRKLRMLGSGANATAVEEYEIDVSAIEALNSVERRAAIETGQEQENIQVTGNISQRSMTLAKVFTLDELEAMKARMDAALEAEKNGKVIEAPKSK